MNYISVAQAAEKWGVSERSARNYCKEGRVDGAFIKGKAWRIPEDAAKPQRKNARIPGGKTLFDVLRAEKAAGLPGGIYHKLQTELTYNSNHIEGSRLTFEQTRYIFETNTIGIEEKALNVDDILETINHFRCIDAVIDNAKSCLSEKFIKLLHATLKNGTGDSRLDWFNVGEYKSLPNEVGGKATTEPERVSGEISALLCEYNKKEKVLLEDIIDFHARFEKIHPFQDGNGRVGRLIMLKECLKNDIVPFIIDDNLKLYYYRGLDQWPRERGYLIDTCLTAQDRFKAWLDYFRISYIKE